MSKRFAFGENWLAFAQQIDDARIEEAVASLRNTLHVTDLSGRTFLDVGSGSGLFSLAASRLGAVRIHSFDYDPSSVACTEAVREQLGARSNDWTVERGDILDADYCRSLGTFDVVYAWGVLHHTGDMWQAMDNACALVAPNGALFLSIYNDQGRRSRFWHAVKRRYNGMPSPLRTPYAAVASLPIVVPQLGRAVLKRQLRDYAGSWRDPYGRGMSRWYDLIDWIGGFPFEVATTDEIFRFCRDRGFRLTELNSVQGDRGCNELVFVRDEPASA